MCRAKPSLFIGKLQVFIIWCGQQLIEHFPPRLLISISSGKAAREMYFRVLAKEEDDLIVMNYSPGPVDTEMTIDIQANSAAPKIRATFKSFRDTNTMLQPIQTAQKFVEIVEQGAYQSGDHTDFYES